MSEEPKTCAVCGKASTPEEPLKNCGKCFQIQYCSVDCQKRGWKSHKKRCAGNVTTTPTATPASAGPSSTPAPSPAASSSAPPPASAGSSSTQRPVKGLSTKISKPFTQLNARTWLHNRPEHDVFKLLIDVYRFRMNDNWNLERIAVSGGLYAGGRSDLPGFKKFLTLAQSRSGLLPTWWSAEKAAECENVGNGGWSSLEKKLDKGQVQQEYGDSLMPMQMRMFGEQVYGRGPGGQPGAGMMQMQMMLENR